MDPVSALAGTVVTILTPYVQKTATAFVETAGQAAYEKATALFDSLKARFVGQPAAAANLDEFAKDPVGSGDVMKAVLKKQLDSDPALKAEVEQRVQDIGPFITIIQRMQSGTDVTGIEAEEVKRGRISVEQNIDEGKNVTGGKFKTIG